MLVLQESGTPSALSYARLAAPLFPELTSFTTCYWLKLTRFREESTLMSYAVSDDRDNELRMGKAEGNTPRIICSKPVLPFTTSYLVCFSLKRDKTGASRPSEGDTSS